MKYQHDVALRDAEDLVCLPESRRIEQIVRRLLERRKHQHAVLHLRDTETRDTQDLALTMHASVCSEREYEASKRYRVCHYIAE